MKLPNSVPSQVSVRIVEIEYEDEQIYHPNFVWYVETSSSADINPMSYHLTAFELTNQLLYTNFPSLERKIFQKDLKSTLPSSVAL